MEAQTGTGQPNVALSPVLQIDVKEAAQHIIRIRRIGKKLFHVANCCVVFGDLLADFPGNHRGQRSVETSFCQSVPMPESTLVVRDAREHDTLAEHPMVADAPHVRFFAACPIRNAENAVIGIIALVDFRPRSFNDVRKLLLEDLARLVERELHLRSLSATQIDLQQKNRNLRRKSLTDPLIGIWNRAAIMRILTIEAIRCAKAEVPLAVIVADLDFFKKINDTFGHPAGDAVLIKVATRLRGCMRPQEALGRYGGEEFLVVLPGSTTATAMAVGERMRQAVAAEQANINGEMLQLTISAGIASTDMFPDASTEDLISLADRALYDAKDAGRNCVAQACSDNE